MEIKRLTKEELQDFTRLKGCKIENLYYRGDISLLQKPEKIIALIGRRNADADVLRNANRCGKILAESGAVTLNGLAVGCDTAGLKGALDAGGKCIAVMPCGLDYIYPKCNDSLVENILKNGGCIVSEYEPGERPEKWKFVNPPRLIRFREYRRGFQTLHELSFMPATLGRSGFLTTDTAQTQWLCRAALPSAGDSGFALDAQSTA